MTDPVIHHPPLVATPAPQTRAEAYAEGVLLEAPTSDEFLPVGIRRALYLVALAGAFIGPLIAIAAPAYGLAIVSSSNGLAGVALGVAIGNARR